MGRVGIREGAELKDILQLIQSHSCFDFEGMFTHFAKADAKDQSYYEQQLKLFNDFVEVVDIKPRIIHASNSAATLMYDQSYFNMIRLGISMYGLTPSIRYQRRPTFSTTRGSIASYNVSPCEKSDYWFKNKLRLYVYCKK